MYVAGDQTRVTESRKTGKQNAVVKSRQRQIRTATLCVTLFHIYISYYIYKYINAQRVTKRDSLTDNAYMSKRENPLVFRIKSKSAERIHPCYMSIYGNTPKYFSCQFSRGSTTTTTITTTIITMRGANNVAVRAFSRIHLRI